MRKTGFTLIEILIVLGIFGVIAIIGVNMFFAILKGSAKTRILTEVKQNGNYALGVMERMVRNARNLESYTGNSITIVNLDGGKTTFACGDSDGNGINDIASNEASLINDQVAVENCDNVFSVNPGELGIQPDEVAIDFTLTQAGEGRGEEKASIDFKTTVTLRNY